MAQTLAARIQLTGADEIRRALADLTAAGARFFSELQQTAARTQFGLGTDQAKSDLLELRKVGENTFSGLAESARQTQVALPVDQSQSAFRAIEQSAATSFSNVGNSARATFSDIAQMAQNLGKTLSGLSGVFNSGAGKSLLAGGGILGAIGGLFALTKSAATGLADVNDKAKDLDISVNDLQRHKFTLQSLGLSDSDVTKALGNFSKAAKAIDAFSDAQEAANEKVIKFAKDQGLILPPKDTEAGKAALQGVAKTFSEIQVQGRPAIDATTAALANFGAAAHKSGDAFDRLLTRVVELNKESLNRERRGGGDLTPSDSNDKAQKDLLEKAFGEEVAGVLQRRLQRLKDQGLTAGEILQKFRDDFDKRKLNVSDEDIKRADQFRGAMDDLGTAVTQLGVASAKGSQEFGLLFAPAFQPAVEALAEGINNFSIGLRSNRGERLAFIEDLGGRATKAIQNFFANLDPAKVITGLKETGENILGMIRGVILPAFEALSNAASDAAKAINNVLGTNFSGLDIGFIATLTLLIGRIDALGIALGLLFTSNDPAVEKFKEHLKTIGIDIDAIKEKVSQFIQDFAIAFQQGPDFVGPRQKLQNEWVQPIADIIRTAPLALASLAAIFIAIEKFGGQGTVATFALGEISGALGAVTKAVQLFAFALVGIAAGVKILFDATMLVAAVARVSPLAALTGIGLVITGLITGLISIVTNLDKIKEGGERVLRVLKFEGVGAALLQIGRELGNAFGGLVTSIFEGIGEAVLTVGELLAKGVDEAVVASGRLAARMLAAISDTLSAGVFTVDFTGFWDGLVASFKSAIESIRQFFSPGVFEIDFTGFWDGLVEAFDGVVESIKNKFNEILSFFKNSFKGVFANAPPGTASPAERAAANLSPGAVPEAAPEDQQQRGIGAFLRSVLSGNLLLQKPEPAPAPEQKQQQRGILDFLRSVLSGNVMLKKADDEAAQSVQKLGKAAEEASKTIAGTEQQKAGPNTGAPIEDAGAPNAQEQRQSGGGLFALNPIALVDALRKMLTVLNPISAASAAAASSMADLQKEAEEAADSFDSDQLLAFARAVAQVKDEKERLRLTDTAIGKTEEMRAIDAAAGKPPSESNPLLRIVSGQGDLNKDLGAFTRRLRERFDLDQSEIGDVIRGLKELNAQVKSGVVTPSEDTTTPTLEKITTAAKTASAAIAQFGDARDQALLGETNKPLSQREFAQFQGIQPFGLAPGTKLGKGQTLESIGPFFGQNQRRTDNTPAPAGPTAQEFAKSETAKALEEFSKANDRVIGKGIREQLGRKGGVKELLPGVEPFKPFQPDAAATKQAAQEFGNALEGLVGKINTTKSAPLQEQAPFVAQLSAASFEIAASIGALPELVTGVKSVGAEFDKIVGAQNLFGLSDLRQTIEQLGQKFQFPAVAGEAAEPAQKFTTKETATGTGKIIQVIPVDESAGGGLVAAAKRLFAPAPAQPTSQEFGGGKIITVPPKPEPKPETKPETKAETKPQTLEVTAAPKIVEVPKPETVELTAAPKVEAPALEVAKPETVEVTASKVELIAPEASKPEVKPAEVKPAAEGGGGFGDFLKAIIKFLGAGGLNAQGLLGGGIQRTQDAIAAETSPVERSKFDEQAQSENIDDQTARPLLLKLNDAIAAKIIEFRDNLIQQIHDAEPEPGPLGAGEAIHDLATALEGLFEFVDKSVEQTKAEIEANQGELQRQIGNADIGTTREPPLATAARSRFDPRTGEIVSNPAFQDFRQGAPDNGDVGVLQRVIEGLRGLLSAPQAQAGAPFVSPSATPPSQQQQQQQQITPVLNTESIAAQAATAAQEFASAFNQALAQVDFSGIGTALSAALTTALQAIGPLVETVAGQIRAAADSAVQALDAVIERATAAAQATAAVASSGAGGGAKGFWTGGKLAGPGTPTSDSIPIWASRDEWVIQAKAASYYGDGLMALLNAGRIPRDLLAAALRGMRGTRGFRLGGAISGAVNNSFASLRVESLAIPGLAAGGAISAAAPSLHPVTIPISVDGRQIANVRAFAQSDAVSELRRAAMRAELTRTGRLPG